MTRFLLGLIAALLLPAAAARADVDVRFFSRDLGEVFPHGFFEVEGPGVPKQNYGFTAKTISPAILWGPVAGKIVHMDPPYIAKSQHHFTVRISDADYARLMALVEQWRTKKSPSYDLYKANCVSFVADAVRLVGLRTNPKTRFMGKPKSFLLEVMQLNPGLKP
jgi:hypothetical protein